MSEKMVIRPITLDDAQFIMETRNASYQFLHDDRLFELEDVQKWIPTILASEDKWYGIIEVGDKKVGYFRLTNISIDSPRKVTIGADIHPDFRRQGHAYRAYTILMDWLFERGMHKIYLEVLSFNKRAICLYIKLGFQFEGARREEVIRFNKYHDSILMSILKKERIWDNNILEEKNYEVRTRTIGGDTAAQTGQSLP